MRMRSFLAAVLIMTISDFASADTIRGINMDFVTIGHAGNPPDTRAQANPYGCGSVGYNYLIGKYEVTNAQWNAFTAIAGVPMGNDGGYSYTSYYTNAQRPVNNVSWYEAAQFCNYLTSGNKSLGAYQLGTDGSITVDRTTAISTYGTAYVIPTEDEWYKAAYYKPNGSGYSLYANGTNTAPVAGVQSNYNGVIGAPWNINTGTQEQNGTFDMMGNVWEWNETLFYGSFRGLRGGSCLSDDRLASSFRTDFPPDLEGGFVGFRVAEVPEPATLFLLGLGGLAVLRKRRG